MNDATTSIAIIGGAVALAKPIVETGCKLVENLLGEPCKVAGGMLADQIYAYQWRNRIKIAFLAKKIMDKNGIVAKVLPAGFVLSFLDKAGTADCQELQDMWANLLVSSVTDERFIQLAYINTLGQLSRSEAIILSGSHKTFLLGETDTEEEHKLLADWLLQKEPNAQLFNKHELSFYRCHLNTLDLTTVKIETWYLNYKFDILHGRVEMGWPSPEEVQKYSINKYSFRLTEYGEFFMEACSQPPKKVRVNASNA